MHIPALHTKRECVLDLLIRVWDSPMCLGNMSGMHNLHVRAISWKPWQDSGRNYSSRFDCILSRVRIPLYHSNSTNGDFQHCPDIPSLRHRIYKKSRGWKIAVFSTIRLTGVYMKPQSSYIIDAMGTVSTLANAIIGTRMILNLREAGRDQGQTGLSSHATAISAIRFS